jgi:hypothetical protein
MKNKFNSPLIHTVSYEKKYIRFKSKIALFLLFTLLTSISVHNNSSNEGKNFKSWDWNESNSNASLGKRVGLQALHFKGDFYVVGRRTPLPPFYYTSHLSITQTISMMFGSTLCLIKKLKLIKITLILFNIKRLSVLNFQKKKS